MSVFANSVVPVGGRNAFDGSVSIAVRCRSTERLYVEVTPVAGSAGRVTSWTCATTRLLCLSHEKANGTGEALSTELVRSERRATAGNRALLDGKADEAVRLGPSIGGVPESRDAPVVHGKIETTSFAGISVAAL
jgi:hypothetical protein